jgi:multidrug resistance efflux pump
MKPTTPQPAWRRVPLVGWLGVALLAASVTITVWVLRSPAGEGTARANLSSPPAERSGLRVVCQGHVDVPGGVTKLYPLQPGRVKEVLKKEGEEVAAGEAIFVLEDRLPQLKFKAAREALAAAKEQREEARRLPEQHAARVAAQKAAIAAKKQEAEAARQTYNEAKRLKEKDVGLSMEKLKAAEAGLNALEEAVRVEEAKLRGLEAVDPAAALRKAEIDVEAKQTQVDEAQYAVDQCTVKAPRAGKILRLLVNPGETLGPNPQQPAVLFCPDVPRIVRVEVEQEFADRVARGQVALIEDNDNPKSQWRGKVTDLSDWYTHKRSIMLEPMHFNDVRTLECIVELDPGQPPLRIGQRVRVTMGQ